LSVSIRAISGDIKFDINGLGREGNAGNPGIVKLNKSANEMFDFRILKRSGNVGNCESSMLVRLLNDGTVGREGSDERSNWFVTLPINDVNVDISAFIYPVVMNFT